MSGARVVLPDETLPDEAAGLLAEGRAPGPAELVRAAALIGRIPGLRKTPFNTSVPVVTTGGTYGWVGAGKQKPVGELDLEKLNVNGGSIALGHPVGTSGGRLIITLLRALRDRGLRRGLAALCVGGGQGVAVWVETTVE